MNRNGKLLLKVPENDYHANPAIGRSAIVDALNGTMREWRELRMGPSKITADMRLGSAAHLAVLEPERFNAEYGAWGERRGTNAFKAYLEESGLDDSKVLSAEDYMWVLKMRSHLAHSPQIAQIMASGNPEVTCYWDDELTGVALKSRADWWNPKLRILMDLKTTRDLDDRALVRAVVDRGYHIQAVHYIEGIMAAEGLPPVDWSAPIPEIVPSFVLAFVGKGPVLQTRLWELPINVLQFAASRRRVGINTIAECFKSGVYPGYPDAIETPVFPDWSLTL